MKEEPLEEIVWTLREMKYQGYDFWTSFPNKHPWAKTHIRGFRYDELLEIAEARRIVEEWHDAQWGIFFDREGENLAQLRDEAIEKHRALKPPPDHADLES